MIKALLVVALLAANLFVAYEAFAQPLEPKVVNNQTTGDKQDSLTLGNIKIPLEDGTNFQLETGDSSIKISPNK